MTETPRSIPTRSRQANRDMVDLTAYYTNALDEDWLGEAEASLATLSSGVQVFAEAAFDVRGLIQLGGARTESDAGTAFPQTVKDIQINYQGKKLHFLHGAVGHAEEDTKIGEYVLHYANGQTARFPIIYRRNVTGCVTHPGDPLPTDADIAWIGGRPAHQGTGKTLRLCRYSVNNPYPDEEIATLDFVSAMAESAPFLIALTVEPNEHAYEGFSMARIDSFCPIAPRSTQAGPDLMDLSPHYTSSMDDNWFCHAGHDLRDVPRGVQVLDGVAFDIRGLVQLAASKSMDVTGVVFPEAVTGIAVNGKGTRLHFLQACFWNTVAGTKIGEYIIRYVDGQTRSAPIIYGENISDWWTNPQGVQLSGATSVWQGSNPATRSMGLITHLIKYTWENPRPDVEISAIDFVSDLAEASPFLVAVTIGN